MSMIKTRNKDYWVIPKNNNDLDRHKACVAFVIYFFLNNKHFPTEKEYLGQIVAFLRKRKLNKDDKKTANYHQLYQPVFFGMLKIDDNKVKPTNYGCLWIRDKSSLFFSELIFLMFESAAFSSSATSTSREYDDVYPIKQMMDILIVKRKLSSTELGYHFHSKTNNKEIYMKDFECNINYDNAKKVQWLYAIRMMEKAGLLIVTGKISKEYFITPSIKLESLYSESAKLILHRVAENISDETFDDEMLGLDNTILERYMEKRINNKRSAFEQSIWRIRLIYRDGGCVICPIKHKSNLIASHIKPYAKSESHEAFDLSNGIILCNQHDSLFDKGMMTIIDGKVTYTKEFLNHDDYAYVSKNDKQEIKLSKKINDYLKFHHEGIYKGI